MILPVLAPRSLFFVLGCVKLGLAIVTEHNSQQAPNATWHDEPKCPDFGYRGTGAFIFPSQTVEAKCWCQGMLAQNVKVVCPVWTFLEGLEFVQSHNTSTDSNVSSCYSFLTFKTSKNGGKIVAQCSVPGDERLANIQEFLLQKEEQDYEYLTEGDKGTKQNGKDENTAEEDKSGVTENPESDVKAMKPFWIYILIVIAAILLIASAAGVIFNRYKSRRKNGKLRRRSARRYKTSMDEPLQRKESNGQGQTDVEIA